MVPARKLALLLLLTAFAVLARADGPDHANLDYVKDVVNETAAIATSPLHWERSEWYEAGGAVGCFTAKAVARAHSGKDGRWTFSAFPLQRGAGAAAAWRFD